MRIFLTIVLIVALIVTGYLRNSSPHSQSCLVSPQTRLPHPVFCTPLPFKKAPLLICKHATSGGNHSPGLGALLAGLNVSLTHIFLFLPTARPTGLRGLWRCCHSPLPACLPADFRLEVICRPKERRKREELPYYILPAIPRDETVGTFWKFLALAKIHRSVAQRWCCVMQAFVHRGDSIESPG